MKKKEEKILQSIKKIFNRKSTRKDFLKWIGFSTASVALSACKGPVIKSIPYIVKPNEITLGVPNYYASTMIDSFDISSVLVKTREGRPIKIEPNTESEYFDGLSTRIQSSIMELYDEKKFKYPYLNGKRSKWSIIDKYVINHLKKIRKEKKDIIFLSPSFPSFSTKKLIEDFKKSYPNTEWIIYDSISFSKALNASKKIFGIRLFPFFDLKNIKLLVSFDADFLGDWSDNNMAKNYALNKNPKINPFFQHIQIECNMSISGANADIRIPKKNTEIKKMLFELYQDICLGKQSKIKEINNISRSIRNLKSKSVVFADGDQESYEMSFLINKKINSNALSNKFLLSKNSDDKKVNDFIKRLQLKNNNIGALLIFDTDPVYSLPYPICKKFKFLIKKIPLSISFSTKKNETNELTNVIAPIPHWLESWGDTNPISNYYTLIQPTIQKIFNTRQMQDSLIIWGNLNEKNYYEYIKKIWDKYIIPISNRSSFEETLFYGFLKTKRKKEKYNLSTYKNFYYKKIYENTEKDKKEKYFELRLYSKIHMGNGSQHNNPWLQELPDPITRMSWGNYITISKYDAIKNGIKNWYTKNGSLLNGNCVNLIKNKKIIINDIPVIIQPGQAIGSIGASLGYGQKYGKVSNLCDGKNLYRIYENFNLVQKNIKIKKTNKIHKFACFQLQNTSVGRNLVKEVDLHTFLKYPKEKWNKEEEILHEKNGLSHEKISIWDDKKNEKKNKTGHHFNLSIDLNSCIGCGSCIIACNSENNIPVVGKEEIINSRDLHWIRIDRYYSQKNEEKKYNNENEKEDFENPKVRFQPIMCQHCENAPCESVCPVGATTHGKQGQNMMTYNRCIGTRYCANNCPYKVRRFNWFDYANNQEFDFNMNNSLGKMILNPDVVIRTRGVMEKCSLCIQKTQYSIGVAKKENRKVEDKEFETACSISCPTKAITFGDINDNESLISEKLKDSRSYKILDFLGVNPNIIYLLKIRNKNKNHVNSSSEKLY